MHEQRELAFEAAARDARVAYRERNNELRARLRSIDPSVAGVSPLVWQYVSEVLMIAWSKTTTTHLTRDQLLRARRTAERLGLVRTTRRYCGGQRQADAVDVDVGAVDRLVTLSRGVECAQVRPSAPSSRSDYFLNLELKTSSSSSGAREPRPVEQAVTVVEKNEEVEVEVEKFLARCRKFKLPIPVRIREAIAMALAQGSTMRQLYERTAWYSRTYHKRWSAEHRRGALYCGLRDARPGMEPHEGWPYSEGGLTR